MATTQKLPAVYELYKLKSGKVHRIDYDGVFRAHGAGYEFVPTPAEMVGNAFRLEKIGEVPESSQHVETMKKNLRAAEIVHPQPNIKQKPTGVDIAQMELPVIKGLLEKCGDLDQLNIFVQQETGRNPIRRKVVELIEARRDELLHISPAEPAAE